MPDFQGIKDIKLQPLSATIPYTFTFPIATGAAANDGAIPFGLTISTLVMTAHKEDGTDASTALISSSSLATNIATVKLKWPTGVGLEAGRYHLVFKLTLSDASIMPFDFNRVIARDL